MPLGGWCVTVWYLAVSSGYTMMEVHSRRLVYGDGRLLVLYFCPLSCKTSQKSCAVHLGTPTSIKKKKFLSESQLSPSDWRKVGFFNRLVSGNFFTGILWFSGSKYFALVSFLMCLPKN